MLNNHAIAKLSPAAARLLLSLLAAQPKETYDDAIGRAGIIEHATVVKARQQLAELGFLSHDATGQEYLHFFPVEQQGYPATVQRASRVTNAEGWK